MKVFALFGLLSSVISARNLKDKEEAADFLSFAGKYNKHYKDKKDMHEHAEVWQANKARVKKL